MSNQWHYTMLWTIGLGWFYFWFRARLLSSNNCRQFVNTHMLLSPSSINLYRWKLGTWEVSRQLYTTPAPCTWSCSFSWWLAEGLKLKISNAPMGSGQSGRWTTFLLTCISLLCLFWLRSFSKIRSIRAKCSAFIIKYRSARTHLRKIWLHGRFLQAMPMMHVT